MGDPANPTPEQLTALARGDGATSEMRGGGTTTRGQVAAAAAERIAELEAAANESRREVEQAIANLELERQARTAAEAEALRLRQGTTVPQTGEASGGTPGSALVDASTLVDAIRNAGSNRDPAIDKGKVPTWDYAKGERFATFQR